MRVLQTMRNQFLAAFQLNSENERFNLAVKLYYRLLENIISKEKSQRRNLDQVNVINCLIATDIFSISIVFRSY